MSSCYTVFTVIFHIVTYQTWTLQQRSGPAYMPVVHDEVGKPGTIFLTKNNNRCNVILPKLKLNGIWKKGSLCSWSLKLSKHAGKYLFLDSRLKLDLYHDMQSCPVFVIVLMLGFVIVWKCWSHLVRVNINMWCLVVLKKLSFSKIFNVCNKFINWFLT